MYRQSKSIALVLAGVAPAEIADGVWVTLQSVTLSPLSVSCQFTCETPTRPKGIAVRAGFLQVIRRDGSTAHYCKVGGVYGNYALFEAPVDLEDVAYVQFGDQRILLPSADFAR